MSRFIDVDKFEEKNAKVWKQFGKETCYYSVGYILSQASVDAIPIEWIEKYTKQNFPTFPLAGGDIVLGFMADMLEDWEKEQCMAQKRP